MYHGDFKMALTALRTSKWRSLLTMLGIIIGIMSVITTVSLGEGIKQQVEGQINRLGSDLITVRPGQIVTRDGKGNITHIDLSATYGFGTGSLTNADVKTVQTTPGISASSPISLITGLPSASGKNYDQGFVLGTSADFPSLIRQKVEYGTFFSSDDSYKHIAIIGKRVAEQLFQENIPVGMSVIIRGEEFIVRGIFNEFTGSALNLGVDLNKAVIIPYPVSSTLMANNNQIVQILARPSSSSQSTNIISRVNARLTALHQGSQDFTVLKQDENLTVTSYILNLLTAFIAGIAAISLLVGGIGIMNIMLVSVSERTREIGIRKAVGATNKQILGQFLIEASVLSLTGGIIGIIGGLTTDVILRVTTNLSPVITIPVVFVATGVSVTVGIIFGIVPAVKAARKDPIDALRYE